MSKRKTLDPRMLAQFTGSTHCYRHGLVREVLYTEGVEYVAETAGAYWLLDEIAWAQRYVIPVKREDFQVWELKVEANHRATLTAVMAMGGSCGPSGSTARISPNRASACSTPIASSTCPASTERQDNRTILEVLQK